jgi:undecaprenyl diphosphate synthase
MTQSQIPQHVAIIMDGNGRWAKQRGMTRTQGHRRGLEALRSTVENAAELGVGYLTVFGFSTENWQRSNEEVSDLMALLRFYLTHELKTLHKKGARLNVIGERHKLAGDIVKLIENAEALTASNERISVTIALSYGSRSEIVSAVKNIAQQVADGRLLPDDISDDMFESALMTTGLPPVDLMIRTSGEVRLSNFLLWQLAYAELIFTDTLWPDFDMTSLSGALSVYASRQRRFGKIEVEGDE